MVDVGQTHPSRHEGAERLLTLALDRPADAFAAASRLLARKPGPRDASIGRQVRGIVLRDSGQTVDALAELRAALRLARASKTPERALDVQATLGLTLGLAGRTDAGLAALDEAVSGSTGVLAGRILMRRGDLLAVLGRHDDALTDLRRAVGLLRRGGDTVWEARARTHRFLVYSALGQAVRADRDLAVAERLFAAAGQELESAMSVHNRADVAFQTGDLPAALRFLDEAEARYTALSAFRPGLALDRCTVLLAAGLAAEALAVTDAAIRRQSRQWEQTTKKAELLFAAARAALAAGELAVATERATLARNLFRKQRRLWWQARASFVMLQADYGAGHGIERLQTKAARVADRLDELGAEEAPTAHLLAGRIASEQGNVADADRHLARAARFRYRGPTFGRAAGWLAHALRAEARFDTRTTLIACRRGLDAAAEHQRTLGAAELRAHATTYGTELAAIAQRHALQRGDARMLLLWTERWRASALAVPPVRPPDDDELAQDLAALRDVMRRLDAARSADSNTTRLEQDRLRLEASIRSRTRRTGGFAGPRSPLLGTTADPDGVGVGRPDIEEILETLGDHRLIEIVALDDMLYAATAVGRRVRIHAIGPVGDAVREVELARFMLRRLAYGLPHAGFLATLDAAGRRLQDALLGPVASEVDERPVVIVPPGLLHAVPWSLLPSLRSLSVRVAPSAATWVRAGLTQTPRHRRVALVIGPGLSGPAAEVEKIANSYADALVLSAGRATADRVLAAMDGAWTAHIAAHGLFRTENPLFSSLRLDDGPLTVYDLGRLRRAPHRLVLSSCESAVSAHVGGDELLGMVSALVPLGTASMLASVVPVNDAATVALMVAFHDRLRTGSSFADALLAAGRDAAHDPVAAGTALSFIALGR